MKKTIGAVFLAVVILAVLASGCAPAPTPAPTPSSTSTPVPPTLTPSPVPPTFTPEPTATAMPTSTPEITPVSLEHMESMLFANGFEVDPLITCDFPCRGYKYGDSMKALVNKENGTFTLWWSTFGSQADTNQELVGLYQKVIRALYPADLAEAIIGSDMNHQGETGGYCYIVEMTTQGDFSVAYASTSPIEDCQLPGVQN